MNFSPRRGWPSPLHSEEESLDEEEYDPGDGRDIQWGGLSRPTSPYPSEEESLDDKEEEYRQEIADLILADVTGAIGNIPPDRAHDFMVWSMEMLEVLDKKDYFLPELDLDNMLYAEDAYAPLEEFVKTYEILRKHGLNFNHHHVNAVQKKNDAALWYMVANGAKVNHKSSNNRYYSSRRLRD